MVENKQINFSLSIIERKIVVNAKRSYNIKGQKSTSLKEKDWNNCQVIIGLSYIYVNVNNEEVFVTRPNG